MEIGQKFNKLSIIEILDNKKVKCICDCGNEKITDYRNLKRGLTKTCGCRKTKHGFLHSKSSSNDKRLYTIYIGLKMRSENKNNKDYKNYGGRGIKCEWASFEEFKNDMYESYLEHYNLHGEKQTTIDRIDVNYNYCKENCKWSTIKEQANNTRKNIYFTYKGETLSFTNLLNKYNININVGKARRRMGWNIEKILETPLRKYINN